MKRKNCFSCNYLRFDSNKDGFCGCEHCDRYQHCVVNDNGIIFRGQCRNFEEKGKTVDFKDFFDDTTLVDDDDDDDFE